MNFEKIEICECDKCYHVSYCWHRVYDEYEGSICADCLRKLADKVDNKTINGKIQEKLDQETSFSLKEEK